jgi:imidazolonepropionase-like amidohydrolase
MTAMQGTPTRIVIVCCSLVTLDERGIVPNQAVTIEGERICRIEDASNFAPDDNMRIIDGRGRFLMAGLTDMHVHIGLPQMEATSDSAAPMALYEDAAAELRLYLDCGVTTVRNMAGAAFHRRLANEISGGLRPGPRVLSSSPILDGERPVWPFGVPVRSLHEASRAVAEAVSNGFNFIKVYNLLSRDAYQWLTEEAASAGLPVVGHVPFEVGVMDALGARQSSIEHLRGYDIRDGVDPRGQNWIDRADTWLYLTQDRLERYCTATLAAGTWNCPTFTVMSSAIRAAHGSSASQGSSQVPSLLAARMGAFRRATKVDAERATRLERSLDVQFAFAHDLYRANGHLLVGTDAGINDIVPGYSLHDELSAFVKMGLTPSEALRVSTRGAANYLGLADGSGTITPGARADLVLLSADPTGDIANARKIVATIAAGRWHQPATSTDNRR